jgi:drug/metabolite transporter (DMT)-like permease
MTKPSVSGATAATLFFAAFCWGANFPLAHLVVGEMSPMAAAVGRFGIAAIVLLAMAAIRREPVRLIRHAPTLGLLSLVGVVLFNVLFFFAMQRTSATNGALLMATNPLLTALLAGLFLGERVSPRHLAALPIALGGVAMVVLGNGANVSLSLGDSLMVGADLSWATYNVLARRLMPAGSPIANMAAMMTYSVFGLIAVALISGESMSIPLSLNPPAAALVVMATLGTVVAYLCYNSGIAKLGAGRAALFLNTVPVWAMIVSALLGHPPSGVQIVGGAIVLTAVVFASLPRRAVAVAME